MDLIEQEIDAIDKRHVMPSLHQVLINHIGLLLGIILQTDLFLQNTNQELQKCLPHFLHIRILTLDKNRQQNRKTIPDLPTKITKSLMLQRQMLHTLINQCILDQTLKKHGNPHLELSTASLILIPQWQTLNIRRIDQDNQIGH